MAIFEGLLSFCNGCGNAKVRCNGRGKKGKEALVCVPKGFKHGCLQVVAKSRCRTHRPQTTTIAMDAKPTKHTQTLTLRKARGIVRFWKGWCGNPSGSRPNFFRRQHLTFNKGGKCGGAKQGIVQNISLMVGRGSNHHHSWLGLTVQQNLTPFFEGGHGCPKLNAQSFARMRNQQSVH